MNGHALGVLEFGRALGVVAGHASSELGAARVRALEPQTDLDALAREHGRVAAVRAAVLGDPAWHPDPIPDVTAPLARIRVEGTSCTADELLGIAQLLRSSRRTAVALSDERRPAMVRAVLSAFADALHADEPAERRIERVIAEDGSVRDDATPALRRIRRELRASHGELLRILEKALNRLDAHHRVSDMSVTMRNGRYVIPVRREGQRTVGGIVHDTSGSGATLFVEPPAAVEFGNRIRELEGEEAEEVERVLLELTDELRPQRTALLSSLETLVVLDSLYARARFAHAHECFATTLVQPHQGFRIDRGRHPLLLAQGVEVVPFDLQMAPGERTLLVSGPNTGGKTVLLKALGLLSLLAQCGIPAPAGPESRIPVFDDVFADVGDEQSIEASLSTFSAHLKNLAEILSSATASSLVLVDELGSGTDPLEGAALGWAILEELAGRGTTTVATTHLGTLKDLATQVPSVINASLQFDAARLAPTYRLIKGIPGRSYGIAIARRLSLPEHVILRAEERLPQQERDVAALIARLEQREAELETREAEVAAMQDDTRTRLATLTRREQAVRERERTAERESRREARRYLLDARAEIEKTIRDLKRSGADAIEEAGREARQRGEAALARQNSELERLEREEANVQRRQSPGRATPAVARDIPIAAGDRVAVATLGGTAGRVVELREADALVVVGGVKLTVRRTALERLAQQEPQERAVAWTGDLPEVHASPEVDLRGMRPDEAETAVFQALDSAIRAELRSLRIIHGKGTGALKDRVTELLKRDTRISGFRMGAWNEGGGGVTIAEL
jgi:DNA mismatch repair protein MutS2